MVKSTSIFEQIKSIIILGTVVLFPLFFLPTTQEFFVTNKLYLLGFSALILLSISTIEFFVTKKLTWQRNLSDNSALLFLLAVVLSTILVSPNKVQAVLNPNFGVLSIFSLTVLFFYISRTREETKEAISSLLFIASGIISVITLIFFFQPFKYIELTGTLQFLKNPYFSTLGNQFDLMIFLGFTLIVALKRLLELPNNDFERSNKTFILTIFSLNTIALLLAFYVFIKPLLTDKEFFYALPPYEISWRAAIDTLKSPLMAVFGRGIDNFASAFTQERDLAFNQSLQWQIEAFNISRSTLLHIFTESGLFGVITIILLIVNTVKESLLGKKNSSWHYLLPLIYIITVVVFFHPSLVVLFLLFLSLALAHNVGSTARHESANSNNSFDVSQIIPLFAGILLLTIIFIISSFYFLSRAYLAEYYFKKSISNNIQDLYNNQVKAIMLNPYVEAYRIQFSQTNMFIANNIAAKAQPKGDAKEGEKKEQPQLSEEDKQNVTQYVQNAILESKAAVGLNDKKASNWAQLAGTYRNILTIAQGANEWTIAAYQRAIQLDPNNPLYRLNMGGIYFLLGDYENAQRFFEQAVSLKPDWANAHYSLAWALYQKKDVKTAVVAMQNTLSLLDSKKDEADYKKAQKELEEFKKQLPKEEDQTDKKTEQGSNDTSAQNKLTLPSPPVASVEPKLQLRDAAPSNGRSSSPTPTKESSPSAR